MRVSERPDIVVTSGPVARDELSRLVESTFGDMVKFVVDVERSVVALGGELHADAEQLLLESGSRQSDVWGGNYLPGRGPAGCLEYTSLINIRPSQGNRSMEVEDARIRERMCALVFELIGRGEALP